MFQSHHSQTTIIVTHNRWTTVLVTKALYYHYRHTQQMDYRSSHTINRLSLQSRTIDRLPFQLHHQQTTIIVTLNIWTTVLVTPSIDYHYSHTAINNIAPPPHALPGQLASRQRGSQFPWPPIPLLSALPDSYTSPGTPNARFQPGTGPSCTKKNVLTKQKYLTTLNDVL